MADKITYHSAITGKFVTKKYAENNPDTTVELTNCNLRKELTKFLEWYDDLGNENERIVDDYFKEN